MKSNDNTVSLQIKGLVYVCEDDPKENLVIAYENEEEKSCIKIESFSIPFSGITIVSDNKELWEDVKRTLDILFHRERIDAYVLYPATRLLQALKLMNICGVSICDKRDTFNRQRGRIIAKGRLLKILKKDEK